jgi:DNA-binding IclR family transcriptional regulator
VTTTASLDPKSVLAKVMEVLDAYGPDDRVLTLAALGRRTGLPKTTIHRVVNDLVAARLLERAEPGFRLSRHLFELGLRSSEERVLVDVAVPYMEDLYELCHETVHLGVRDGFDVVYLAKIGGHRQVTAPSRVGGRLPLHCTAIGKALLAHSSQDLLAAYFDRPIERRSPRTVIAHGLLRRQLDEVSARGIAFEHEESAVGLACVAAPVLGLNRDVRAAVSVSGPVTRFDPSRMTSHIRAAATGIQAALALRSAEHGDPVTGS